MTAKIVFVAGMPGAAETARDLLPAGFELVIAVPRSAKFVEAIGDADYLVGFVDDLGSGPIKGIPKAGLA